MVCISVTESFLTPALLMHVVTCCLAPVVVSQIFIEDLQEVELLPRDRVLEYLERTAKPLIQTYLVSVIAPCIPHLPQQMTF